MQSTSCKMLGWIKLKLESRLLGDLRYADDTTLVAESKEELKSIVLQAPLSVGFSRQEYWSGSHSLLQGIFLTLGLSLGLCIADKFFTI